MKALKSHPRSERTRRINNRINLSRYSAGLVLALVSLISAALMQGPIQLASAQTIALGWSSTGSLNTPRSSHTATLLPDGKVLVAGGDAPDGGLDSAEVYDPATGKWNATGRLNVARTSHTATLLNDGTVLVAGGAAFVACFIDCFGYSLNGAELYDPQNERWSVTGSLNTSRLSHTATLLKNGKVLVAGGFEGFGIDFEPRPLDTAELYDPDTGMWRVTGNLDTPRIGHTATLLKNGKVLILGNSRYFPDQRLGSPAELYDPDTGTWSSIGSVGDAIGGHTATLLADGRVLIVSDNSGAQLYDPETGVWSSTGHLNGARVSPTATLLPDGKVLVAGGWRHVAGRPVSLRSSEFYDPDSGTWSFAGSLQSRRSGHTATLLPDGIPMLVGGGDAGSLASVELGNTFAAVTPPKITRASVARKNLIVVGENFNPDAAILINGEEQKTRIDEQNPQTTLISEKVGKNIRPGDRLRVRNSDDILSEEFIFTGSPKITMASVAGRKLIVVGENFDPDAVILINGEEQKTRNDDQNPQTRLIGKNAGKKIRSGDRLQVRNSDDTLSEEFIFTGS